MNKSAKPVKKRSAAVSSAKPVKKSVKVSSRTVSAAVKPAKKRSARLASAKAVAAKPASEELKPKKGVPLAEVEVLAAKAVKMIMAKKPLSAIDRARMLADVADSLRWASKSGTLSKCGAWGLAHPFGVGKIIDMEAVLQ